MSQQRSFSQEVRARLAECRRRWLDEGYETAPADRDAAREAVDRIYRRLGLRPPRIVWCGSPLAMMLAANIVVSESAHGIWFGPSSWRSARDRVGPDLKYSVETLVEWSLPGVRPSALSAQLPSHRDVERYRSISQEIRKASDEDLSAPVMACTDAWLVEAVQGALGLEAIFRSVRRWTWEAFGELPSLSPGKVRDLLVTISQSQVMHAQHDADWVGLCDYFFRSERPAKSALCTPYGKLAACAGWVLPRAEICWICERPAVVRRSASGLLHATEGPALIYRDGWEAYFRHGVNVPRSWIQHAEALGLDFVYGWQPAAQRQILVDLVGGWERLLSQVPTRTVDVDPDPTIGTLLERPNGSRPARFLRVLCGTGRSFVLPVPSNCSTAREANAWTYGLSGTDYQLEART